MAGKGRFLGALASHSLGHGLLGMTIREELQFGDGLPAED